jgi:hypothetical protein
VKRTSVDVLSSSWQVRASIIARKHSLCSQAGVDVMITIFCDFSQFFAKKLAFFTNINVMIKFLLNLALF